MSKITSEIKKDKTRQALLTLHFLLPHMQLVFLLEKHTAQCVTAMLDTMEKNLEKNYSPYVFR